MREIKANLQRHLNTLCLDIGSKHIGSPANREAATYIEEEFKKAGYPVEREEYPVTGWNFKSFSFWNLTRNCPVPGAVPCFFSQTVDVSGELCWIPFDKIDEPGDVKGKICFLEYWTDGANVKGRNDIAENLEKLGAAGAIFISDTRTHTSFAASTKIQRSPFLKTLGTCAVAEEGAFFLARHKTDTYQLKIVANTFDHMAANIIAKSFGSGKNAVIGAHYDTAPLVQGAGDNISGTAMLIEVARLFKESNNGWNLDFAAFDAEEYIPEDFPPGSKDYVMRRLDKKPEWFLNFDDFGLLIGGPAIRVGYPERLPKLHSNRYPFLPYSGAGDDKTFHAQGIPTMWYIDRKPWGHLHTELDAIESLDFVKMSEGVIDAVELLGQLVASC